MHTCEVNRVQFLVQWRDFRVVGDEEGVWKREWKMKEWRKRKRKKRMKEEKVEEWKKEEGK